MMARSRGELSITMLAVIVIALLVIWFVVFPMIKQAWNGAQSAYNCQGTCVTACGDGYMHQLSGDLYCDQQYKGTVCCEPLQTGPGSFVRGGDIQLYFNSKTDLVPNGATVTLVPQNTKDFSVGGNFILDFGDSLNGKYCYWEVSNGDWSKNVLLRGAVGKVLFSSLYSDYLAFSSPGNLMSEDDITKIHPVDNEISPCSSFAGTSPLSIAGADKYLALIGQTMKFSLVVVDPSSCGTGSGSASQATIDQCNTYTYTVNVQVPDRNPVISLKVNNAQVSPSAIIPLTPDQSYTLAFTVTEPFPTCTATAIAPFYQAGTGSAVPAGLNTYVASLFGITTSVSQTPGVALLSSDPAAANNQACFASKSTTKTFTVNVPKDAVRGIPFNIEFNNTLIVGSKPRVVRTLFKFQVTPDPRVTVQGPTPGLTKDKQITLACTGVACTASSFQEAFTADPTQCKAGPTGLQWSPLKNLTSYADSNHWRFNIVGESENGKFLCVKASTSQGDVYALGLWNGAPSQVTIDATPPVVSADWNPFVSNLTMQCNDPVKGSDVAYVSGCKARPYSYAYITDPLSFVTSVLTGGQLMPSFGGCPDPNTGYWIPWNNDVPVMQYMSSDVRVICIRATDNAGNSAVTSKLLYSGQEALALFLRTYAAHS